MSGTSKPSSKGGDSRKVGPGCFLVALVGMVGFAACTTMGGGSGHGAARDAGIPISYSDYHDMCDVHSGEFVRGMDIDRTWTSAQDRELRKIIADDPNCQPDGE